MDELIVNTIFWHISLKGLIIILLSVSYNNDLEGIEYPLVQVCKKALGLDTVRSKEL
jgi:hypothetical protein